MTVTKHFCDRCGELISQDRTQLKNWIGPFRHKRAEVDFCSSCYGEFAEWLGPEPGRKPEASAA